MWNQNKGLRRSMLAAALAALPVLATGSTAGGGQPNVPTPQMLRAQKSVQLAVAMAGSRLVSVGERGIVLLSDDGGQHWRQARVPAVGSLTALSFATPKKGWAVGHGGIVLTTDDGGESWSKVFDGAAAAATELASATAAADPRRLQDAQRLVQEGADKPFLSVQFLDEKRGMVAGAYGLLFATDDGGRNWTSLMGRIDNAGGRHLYAVQVVGGQILLAGEQGSLFRAAGWNADFKPLATPYKGTYFGVLAPREGELLAYGLRGNAYRSVDQGANWEQVSLPQVSLSAGMVTADGGVVLANEAGQLFLSKDHGKSFSEVPVVNAFPFTGLAEAADRRIILSGIRGVSLQSLMPSGEGRP